MSEAAIEEQAKLWPDRETLVKEVLASIPDEELAKLRAWLDLHYTGENTFSGDTS